MLDRQLFLLKLEYDYEKRSYEESFAQSVKHNGSNSNCWFPIALHDSFYNAINQYIIEISYDGNCDINEDCEFEPGKSVQFFHQIAPDSDDVKMISTVCPIQKIKGKKMQISIPSQAFVKQLNTLAKMHKIGVRMALDKTTYEVMFDAIRNAISLNNENWVHLRDTLIGDSQPQFRDLPPLLFSNLNSSQNEAVNKILNAREVAIVHGPPGTGKTTTLVEAILETARRESQVLVCAPSNAAVDWISDMLLNRGASVLRIGNPLRINSTLMECTYERQYAAHPDYPELWGVRKLIRDLHASKERSHNSRNLLPKLYNKADDLSSKINTEVLDSANVITSTLIGSANQILRHRHFHTVFIDEATQALEPACWAAILKADRVIFAGDHQQLPPTIKSPEAAKNGLSDTLMQKIVGSKPTAVTLLDTQYRMNEEIMTFSSNWFYDGRLKAAPEVSHRKLAEWDSPLVWIDTAPCHFEERINYSKSRLNKSEALLLVDILKDYVKQMSHFDNLIEHIDFGIISPYKAQISLLRRLVNTSHTLGHLRGQITINTVDGFQGQERDIILISMVRDNERGAIGFLNDLRRMNVAITRARKKLIVVGNTETLAKTDFYCDLINYFRENGIVKEPPTKGKE